MPEGVKTALTVVITALTYLGVLRLLDRLERDPWHLQYRLLLFGGVGGVIAGTINHGIHPSHSSATLVLVVAFALVEETTKFLSANLSVGSSPHFNEPFDGMVYLMTASLGFAIAENIVYAFTSWKPLEAMQDRALTTTLGHVVWPAIVGFAWGNRRKAWQIISAIGVTTLLHAAYNYPILVSETQFGFLSLTSLGLSLSVAVLLTILAWQASPFGIKTFDQHRRQNPARGPEEPWGIGGESIRRANELRMHLFELMPETIGQYRRKSVHSAGATYVTPTDRRLDFTCKVLSGPLEDAIRYAKESGRIYAEIEANCDDTVLIAWVQNTSGIKSYRAAWGLSDGDTLFSVSAGRARSRAHALAAIARVLNTEQDQQSGQMDNDRSRKAGAPALPRDSS